VAIHSNSNAPTIAQTSRQRCGLSQPNIRKITIRVVTPKDAASASIRNKTQRSIVTPEYSEEMVLQTERLILRRWKASDHKPFASMNADPRVMRFMPGVLSEAESIALVSRIESHFEQHGFGVYALEHDGEFIGFTGLWIPTFAAEFTPCVEIAWRLRSAFQNQGFATEAARAVIRHAFS